MFESGYKPLCVYAVKRIERLYARYQVPLQFRYFLLGQACDFRNVRQRWHQVLKRYGDVFIVFTVDTPVKKRMKEKSSTILIFSIQEILRHYWQCKEEEIHCFYSRRCVPFFCLSLLLHQCSAEVQSVIP